MQHVQDLIQDVSATLVDMAQSDIVVGAPVKVGDVTIVPISRIAVGFGGGGGEGEGNMAGAHARKKHADGSGKGKAVGSGAGATVRPVAVAVFSKDGVEILPIAERTGKLEKFLDQLPDLMERFKKSAEA